MSNTDTQETEIVVPGWDERKAWYKKGCAVHTNEGIGQVIGYEGKDDIVVQLLKGGTTRCTMKTIRFA